MKLQDFLSFALVSASNALQTNTSSSGDATNASVLLANVVKSLGGKDALDQVHGIVMKSQG